MEPNVITQSLPVANVPVGAGVTDVSFTASLTTFLRALEGAGNEVTGVGLFEPAGGGQAVNLVDIIERDALLGLPLLEVFIIANEAALRSRTQTHTPVKDGYAVMLVGTTRKNVLVARPGRSLMLSGRISTFGGPGDTGMKPTEGLAIVRDADITGVPGIADFFPPGTTKALGRSLLNKTTSYISCRWDYRTTPRNYLVKTDVEVRNPATGKIIKARPVDWGPAEWTNRVADLSDFAAAQLGLKTNDVCEVVIPLPAGVSGPVLSTATGNALRDAVVAVARGQYQTYQGVHESHKPLSTQIEKYWNDLKADTGSNDFTFVDTDVAWSAVFVSWCLLNGGVKHSDFGFAVAHSLFVNGGIARHDQNPKGLYSAFPIDAHAPEPGDIIHHNRPKGTVSYAQARNRKQYESHSAIVVDKGEDDKGPCVITVGGNEGQSVGWQRHALDSTGKLIPRGSSKYISVIKLG